MEKKKLSLSKETIKDLKVRTAVRAGNAPPATTMCPHPNPPTRTV